MIIRYTMRKLQKRSVQSGRGRRKSVTRDARRSALRLTHAKLKDRRIRKLGTLKKLYNYPREASARPYRAQHPERSRIVAVLLPVVGVLLASLPRHHQLHTTAVAAKSLHAKGLSEKVCRIGL